MLENLFHHPIVAPKYNVAPSMVISACHQQNTFLLRTYSRMIDFNSIVDINGHPLLHIAISNNKSTTFKTLLELGIDLELTSIFHESTALNYAAELGNKYYLEQLIGHGANVNQRDIYGSTPLANAIFNEHYDIANVLCKNPKVDVNISMGDFVPPIAIAFDNGHHDVVENILKHPSYDATFTEIILRDLDAPRLTNFLREQNLSVDNHLIEMYDHTKIFGLKYDLDGCFNFKQLNSHDVPCFSFEGYSNQEGKIQLASSFEHFYDEVVVSSNLPAPVFDIFASVRDSILFTANHDSAESYRQQILAGKAVLIPTGWDGHSVVLVVHNDKLFRCNRGHLSDGMHGIEEFQIKKPNNLTSGFIEKLLVAGGDPDFVQNDMIELLGLQKIGEVENPTQIAGNCVWTSMETGVEAVLLANFVEYGFDTKTAHDLSKNTFSVWEQYDLNASLKTIIDDKPFLAESGIYGELLLNTIERHHDASNIFDLQKGIVVFNELNIAEYSHTFYEEIGQYVIKHDPSCVHTISYMAPYAATIADYNDNWSTIYLGAEEKIRAKEYHDFLKACDQYQKNLDLSAIDITDVLNMSIIEPLENLFQDSSSETTTSVANTFFTARGEAVIDPVYVNPYHVKPEVPVHAIEHFA